MRLKDKVAIVTGGAQAIGKAYFLCFGKEGDRVVDGGDVMLWCMAESVSHFGSGQRTPDPAPKDRVSYRVSDNDFGKARGRNPSKACI